MYGVRQAGKIEEEVSEARQVEKWDRGNYERGYRREREERTLEGDWPSTEVLLGVLFVFFPVVNFQPASWGHIARHCVASCQQSRAR